MKKNKKGLPKNLGLFAFVFVAIISVLTLIVGLGSKAFKNTVQKQDTLAAGSAPSRSKTLDRKEDRTYTINLDVTGESEKKFNKVNVLVVFDRSGSMTYPTINVSTTGRYGYVNGGGYVTLYSDNRCRNSISNNSYSGTVYYNYGNNGCRQYTESRYSNNTTTTETRLKNAQAGVNNVAQSLLANNGKVVDGETLPNDLVEMALVTFSTTASTGNKTTSYTTFSNSVNNITATGGTNWEDALTQANNFSFGDSDPTYIIFVSDGNPTYRKTRGGNDDPTEDASHNSGSYYGSGNSDINGKNYLYAKQVARNIVTGNKKFYAIGAYGNVDKMGNLVNYAYTENDNGTPTGTYYYNASSTEELNSALNAILDDINTVGIGDVSIVDGTTQQVSVSSEVVNLLEVDESSYKYYTKAEGASEWKEWTITDPDMQAKLVNGSVEWDISKLGVLENGTTYRVSFDVYPSQYTNDLIADLKNGEVQYSELQATTGKYAGLAEYIKPTSNGDYTLETNTTAILNYTDTRVSNTEQHVGFVNPPPVDTLPDQINMHKTWENVYDSKRVGKIDIEVLRDGEDFYPISLTDPSWVAGPINISSGLMRVHYASDGETITGIEVLNKGHDYTFKELGDESYNWEMVAETLHPMVINGQLKELVLIDRAVTEDYTTGTTSLPHYAIPTAMDKDSTLTFYQEGGNNYYRLDPTHPEKVYIETTALQPTIEAYNFRRSNLNIQKKVDGESANPEDTFEFTIKVDDEGLSTGELLWFSVYDKGYVELGDRLESSGWEKYVNEKGETYYKGANNTELKVKLKASENLRFTNLTTQATFEVVESDPTVTNYSYSKGEFHAWYGSDSAEIPSKYKDVTITDSERKVKGSISLTNASFYVWMYNTYELVDVEVEKEFDDANNQDAIRPSTITVNLLADGKTAKDDEGNEVEPVEITIDANGKGSYKFEKLPRFNSDGSEIAYTVTEDTVDDYTTTIEDKREKDANGNVTTVGKFLYKITNTHEPAVVDKTIVKVWADDDDRDSLRPDSITMTLQADGVNVPSVDEEGNVVTDEEGNVVPVTVTLTEANSWTQTVTGLPQYKNVNNEQVEIAYTWVEPEVTGYTPSDPVISENTVTITNTHEIATKSATVTKAWDDDSNRDGVRPTSIVMTLYDDKNQVVTFKDETGANTSIVTLTGEGNEWTKTVTGLPANRKNTETGESEPITYHWTEDTTKLPTGYSQSSEATTPATTNDTTRIVNSYEPSKQPVTVTKIWVDESNVEGFRPETVTIDLFANGTKVTNVTPTMTKSQDGNTWTYVYPDMLVNENGQPIEYTIAETQVENYDEPSINQKTLTVTNSRTVERDKVTVTKVWDDESDLEGFRPETVTIDLFANNTKVTDVTPTMTKSQDENTWTYVYDNMLMNEGGEPITYTIAEAQVENYDEPSINQKTLTVTNSRTVVRDELIVTKIWDDESDIEGFRPDTISVTLYANKVEVKNATPTITKTGDKWTLKYENLPVYANGEVIDYTVAEETVANYNAPAINQDTLTITNTHVPGRQAITVTKVWDDESDLEGFRPETVTIDLFANNTKVTDVTPTMTKSQDGNTWTYVYDNMLVNEDGKPIKYTIAEEQVANYNKPVIDQNTLTVTNSRTVSRISINAKKVWNDNNNQDGLQPTSVTIELVANGVGTGVYKEASGPNWSVTFDNLKENEAGQVIKYSVKESPVPNGYIEDVSGTMASGFTITNTHTPETTEVTFTKVWVDGSNHDGMRPEILPLTLKADGKAVSATPTITKDGDTWTITYTGLPKFAGTKTPIVYTIEEGEVANYQGVVEGNTITNTHTPATVDIKVAKQWYDNSNQDGARPGTVTLTLYADGKEVQTATFSGEGNVWYHVFEDLDKYTNDNGKPHEIVYTVDEKDTDVPEGYEKSKDGLTIKNTHSIATTEVTGTKIWEDDEDRDGIRPDSVTVKLLANGAEALHSDGKTKVEPILVSEANNWAYTFTDLPKYQNGAPITYTVAETEDVKGYTPEIIVNNDKINIKNTHIPETVTISGTKVWDDADDQDGKRPASITIKLMVGEEVIQSTNVTEADDWEWAFTELTKNENGKPIEYRIVEVQVDEYDEPKVENVDESEYEYTVTNTHTPETVTFTIHKDWRDDEDRDGIRPKSIVINILANGGKAHYTNGKEVPEQVITDVDNWDLTIENLPKYSKGKPITYSFTEVVVEGYETEIIPNEENPTSITIVNTHTPEETEIEITKTWEEDQYYLDRRPDMITVEIYADGVYLDTIKVYKDDNWTAKVSNLYKYNGGKPISYTIKEKEVDGYVSQVSGTQASGYEITNTFVDGEGCTDCEEPPHTRIDITFDNDEEYYTFVTLLVGAVALSASRKFEM